MTAPAGTGKGDRIKRSHRFTITPEHLILDPRVSDRAFRLWCRLDRYAGDHGNAFPSRETLSVELDCSLASVDRAMDELILSGWASKQQSAAGGTNEYTLNCLPEKAVMALVEADKERRRERWAGQRAKQRRAARERRRGGPDLLSVVTDDDTCVVTGEDTCVVMGDGHVSSPVTTCVVMGDAQKEASLNENQRRSSGTAQSAAPAIAAAPGAPLTHAAAIEQARTIVTNYMDWLAEYRNVKTLPESSRAFNALVGAGRTAASAQYVTAALLAGTSSKDIRNVLARHGKTGQGVIPSKAWWTDELITAQGGAPRPRRISVQQDVDWDEAMARAQAREEANA